jgi:hypothetical protein
MNSRVLPSVLGLPPPLSPLRDMPANWETCETDFDTAAETFIQRHQADGEALDMPIMDLRSYGVAPDGEHFSLRPLAGHQPPLPLRSTAFSALCARLGAPADFVRERLTAAPIQLAVLNYLMAQGERPDGVVLRLRGNQVTCLVSQRYAPLDAHELVGTIRAALARHGLLEAVRVRGLATGVTDVIRLVLPAESVNVKVGDVSMVGLDVSSSSFGKSAVRIRGLCFRLICSNGLRTTSSMGDLALRHLGETQRLRDGVADGIATALVHARGLMDRFRASVATYVTGLAEYIDSLRELSQGEQQAVRVELGANRPAELPERVSTYDLVNAMTQAAQESEPARRIELESIAGGVLLDQTGGRS